MWDASESGSDAVEFHRYLSTGVAAGLSTAFIAGAGQTVGPHIVKALPGGGFVFAYEQGSLSAKDVYVGVSLSNSPLSLDSTAVGFNNTLGDQSAPKIAVLIDGRYVVSWTNAVNGIVETHAQILDPRTRAVNWVGKDISEQYQGTAYDDSLNGGGGNDIILGNDGWDTLNGGSGSDILQGGDGSDSYVVDDAGDQVIETVGGGASDIVYTSISYALASNVEHLTANGAEAITLTGNGLSNALKGNAGANKLNGGSGNDTLSGGEGSDVFVFTTKPNKKTNLDKITDFNVKADSIWLDNKVFTKLGRKGSEANPAKLNKAFFRIADKAKDKNDYLVYDKKKGILYYDADGSGKGKAVEIASLKKGLKMTAADFFIV